MSSYSSIVASYDTSLLVYLVWVKRTFSLSPHDLSILYLLTNG